MLNTVEPVPHPQDSKTRRTLPPRPRVLLASDNSDFLANFATGYQRLGFDVVAGVINFYLDGADYDLVHVLWPEELTGWEIPTNSQIDLVFARLDRFAKKSRILFSVNNLYPHHYLGNSYFHRLYSGVYERAEVIHHFSHVSKELVCREYPSIAGRNHLVRLGFNYERLLPAAPADRDAARRSLDLDPEHFVFLVFGSLRSWDEVRLLQKAFHLARVPSKQLLVTAQCLLEPGPIWRQRYRRWRWRRWLRSGGVQAMRRRVPDEELAGLFAAADAVITIRQNSLSSGVPSLAMTFGRYVIAPDFGGISEYLAGTANSLYVQDSAESLANAMQNAAAVDRERIGADNARLAAEWGWAGIVGACLDALPPAGTPVV